MTSSTHSNSTTPSQYHVLVVYLVDEDGYLGGGFRIEPMKFGGGVCGRSFDELHAECYESLAVAIEVADNAPFDIKDPRKSVVFDFVECLNEDEYGVAEQMDWAGDTFESITEAIQQLRRTAMSDVVRQDETDQELAHRSRELAGQRKLI